MTDHCEGGNPYDDDLMSDNEPLPKLAIRLLQAHRENPADDNYILLEGESLSDTDAAYTALNNEALVQYTNRIVDVLDERRQTVHLTRNGL